MLRGQRECEPPTSREEPFPWLPTPGPPKGKGGQSWPLLSYVVTDSEALKLVSQKQLKKLTSAPAPRGPCQHLSTPAVSRKQKSAVSARACGTTSADREAKALALGQSKPRKRRPPQAPVHVADQQPAPLPEGGTHGQGTRARGRPVSVPVCTQSVCEGHQQRHCPRDGEEGALGFTAPVPRILSCSPDACPSRLSRSGAVGPHSSVTPPQTQPAGTQRPPQAQGQIAKSL